MRESENFSFQFRTPVKPPWPCVRYAYVQSQECLRGLIYCYVCWQVKASCDRELTSPGCEKAKLLLFLPFALMMEGSFYEVWIDTWIY